MALFFAASSVRLPGEGPRTSELTTRLLQNITAGIVTIEARIPRRAGNLLFGQCEFRVGDALMAHVTAAIEIVPV